MEGEFFQKNGFIAVIHQFANLWIAFTILYFLNRDEGRNKVTCRHFKGAKHSSSIANE